MPAKRQWGPARALIIAIVAEMCIGSSDDRGERALEAQRLFEMADRYAAIVTAGALGLRGNAVFLPDEERFVHGTGK